MEQVQQKPQVQIMQVLQNTPAVQIAELDIVRNKFIQNYNFCHKEKVGELMYHRQVTHFKQLIAASDDLKKSDPFSLYACFVTAAVNGYSMDPADSEVYLVPIKGKAYLWRQAGAHVRRLMQTGQILYADQAKLVYQDDEFEVVNGRVVKHVEKFKSENILGGYVRFVVDKKGNDKFFIYRKSDWDAWRKKNNSNGDNWTGNGGQPQAAFLRTKIIKHAATDKSWSTGSRPPLTEEYGVEIEEIEDLSNQMALPPQLVVNSQGAIDPPITNVDDDSFTGPSTPAAATVTHDDDDF